MFYDSAQRSYAPPATSGRTQHPRCPHVTRDMDNSMTQRLIQIHEACTRALTNTRSISSKTTPPRVSEPRREGDSKRDAREPRRTSRDAPSHEPRNASREQTRAPRHARSRRVSARGGDSPRRLTIEFESVYLLTSSGRSLGEGDVKKHREEGARRGGEARRQGEEARRRGDEEARRRG